ncbi:MAG TPA: IclR family transcriptional regulator [Pseudonocardiaceae bacterium]|nr:IclR family transcriptional regulator [Pseudonocardiaceae bacterium]
MGRVVPAVARAVDILDLFLTGAETLSMPEMTAALGLPRATVHDLVSTLVDRALLAHAPGQPHRYRLGHRLCQLGNAYAERLDLPREGTHVAAEVAARCAETVHVAVLDGADVVYVAKVDSTQSVRLVSAVGRRLPAHCTAVGKMLLAGLPPDDFAARYPTDTLPGMTSASITDTRALTREINEIRACGLAFDHCESNPSVACVAAGVHDRTHTMVAAMSISVPTVRWSDDIAAALALVVTEGARRLSTLLGDNRHS